MTLRKSRIHNLKKSHFRLNRFNLVLLVGALSIILIAVLALQPSVQAQTPEDLASQFAPVLHFTQGEKFYPTTVNYIIQSSVLKQRGTSGTSSIVDSAPTPGNLGTYTSNDLFLDNKLATFENIANDYSSNPASLVYTAYVHVVTSSSSTVLQYWLFYAYNNGPLNDHQGDIEVIEVFLDTAGNPQTVLLSQHGAGQNAAWGDVEKVDNHPVVYVAQGSHANYFRSYQGKMGIESDVVGSDGKTIMPADMNLVMLGEQGNHPASQSWLEFRGRWGYWGTEQDVALGRAGPYGPVFNQDGTRWAQPESYLASTLSVNGNYFILAWLVSSFLLFFIIYIVARGAWKGWCIFKLKRKGGLMVGRFLKGRGGIGLMLGIAAIIVTVIALFLPWYTITASSATGPLAQQGGVTLMTIDGVHGVTVNMFLGIGNSDASSGYMTLFSTQLPFAIIIGAGIVFLALDVIGVRSGKTMGKKLWFGIITTIIPIILVIVFISQLPALLPFANGLFPGQSIPTQVGDMMRTIAASPVQGATSSTLPVVGVTTVNWGLAVGVYLFIVAIVLRIIGGFLMYTTPDLQKRPVTQFETPPLPPPPPPT
jgi:hypothetical protein